MIYLGCLSGALLVYLALSPRFAHWIYSLRIFTDDTATLLVAVDRAGRKVQALPPN